MKKRCSLFAASCSLLALSACSQIPGKAYYNRGDPENLIDVSAETVTIGLASRDVSPRYGNSSIIDLRISHECLTLLQRSALQIR